MSKDFLNIAVGLVLSILVLFVVDFFASSVVTELSFLIITLWWAFFFYWKFSDKILGKTIILGLFLRSGLAVFQRFFGNLPDSTSDAVSFEKTAWEFATAWIKGVEAGSHSSAYLYSKVIAVIYYFLDRTPLIAQFLNVIMGVAIIYFVYKAIIVLFNNKKAGYIGAFITAIYPTLNLYSAILLRESVIIFFFVLSFLFFSLWIKKGELKNIILSVIFIFISSMFHGGVFLAGLVYLFLPFFYQPEKKRWRLFSKQLMIGVLITIIYSTLFFAFFASKIPFFTDVTPERMEETTESRATGRTVYLEGMETDSFFDIVWQTPVRIVYFYFAPFPWDVENYKDVGGLINSLFYLVLFTFFIKTLFYLWREDKALFWVLVLILLVFSGAFAWGTSNYGTAFRHKTKVLFLIVVVASYSASLINWKKIKNITKEKK